MRHGKRITGRKPVLSSIASRHKLGWIQIENKISQVTLSTILLCLLFSLTGSAADAQAAANQKPSLRITSPAGETVSGLVDFQIAVPEDATSVRYYVDETQLSELTNRYAQATNNSPVWNGIFDAGWFPSGYHMLRVIATTPEGSLSAEKRVLFSGPAPRPEIVSLNGAWRFSSADELPYGQEQGAQPPVAATKFDDRGWASVVVPDSIGAVDQRWMRDEGLLGTYRRHFTLNSPGKQSGVFLVSDSCFWSCRYFVNGTEVGKSHGGYLPRRFDITGAAHAGDNIIAVIVDDRSATMGALSRLRHFYWNYTGLLQEIRIEITPDVAITEFRAQGAADGSLTLYPVAVNTTGAAQHLSGFIDINGPDGGVALAHKRIEMDIPAGGGNVSPIAFTLKNPLLWDLDHPNLYQVHLTTERAGHRKLFTETTGFRDIEVRGSDILLNGNPVTGLQGFNRHADFPGLGKTQPDGLVEREIKLLHDKGFRLFRPAHYPTTTVELNAADKYGMLVLEEINVTGLTAAQIQTEEVLSFAHQQLELEIARDRSHPSIFAWSVGNENRSDQPGAEVYVRNMIQFGKQLDKTRLFTHVSNRYGKDICYPLLDFVATNFYAGWYTDKLDNVGEELDKLQSYAGNKPLLLSEYGAEAVFNRPGYDKGTEYFQAQIIDGHNRLLRGRPHFFGKMWWTASEFIVGADWAGGNPKPVPPYHTKGLLTYYRQPKLGWRVMFSPIAMDEIEPLPMKETLPFEETRRIIIRNTASHAVSGKLMTQMPAGISASPAEQSFTVPANQSTAITLTFRVTDKLPEGEAGIGMVRAVVDADTEALPQMVRVH